MKKVIACIHRSTTPHETCDYAAWATLRLDARLEFLHALDRHPEVAPVADYSGSIGLGTQESLLAELSTLDEARSKIAIEQGRQLLEGARRRATAAGVPRVDVRQRHGSLIETLLDMQHEARLIVMGQNHRIDSVGMIHLDHNIERVVRAVQAPILVAAKSFTEPRRFVVAFDGSSNARKMVQVVAQTPLLAGIPCSIAMAGKDSSGSRQELEWARNLLSGAACEAESLLLPGHPESAILELLGEHPGSLLVMGAYGHSRIRQLIVGSTTTTLLRTSPGPALVLH
jgi:nucleotide-binding universal stress UspA family protein